MSVVMSLTEVRWRELIREAKEHGGCPGKAPWKLQGALRSMMRIGVPRDMDGTSERIWLALLGLAKAYAVADAPRRHRLGLGLIDLADECLAVLDAEPEPPAAIAQALAVARVAGAAAEAVAAPIPPRRFRADLDG